MAEAAGSGKPQSSYSAANPPNSVLFVCRHNVIRSPMAAAVTRALYPRQIYSRSAGVMAGAKDPFVAEVLREIGLDIDEHKPHSFEALEDSYFDLIVTLAPEAHHMILSKTRTEAVEVEYWPTVDPSATYGSRAQVLEAYRAVRDDLYAKIKTRFG